MIEHGYSDKLPIEFPHAESLAEQCEYLDLHSVRCHYRKHSKRFCPLHASAKMTKPAKVQRMYNLQKWRARVDDFKDHDEVKGLRSEIGILRMTLENVVNTCQTESDILIHQAKIADLATRIQKLVDSCSKLERLNGKLLDKTTLLQIAEVIIGILSAHIQEPEKLEAIAQEIADKVLNAEFIPDDKETSFS